jgi:hypothetical protein
MRGIWWTRSIGTLGVMLLLVPALAGAQTRVRLFVDGGPSVETNSAPFSLDAVGANIGVGAQLTPTLSVGFNTERVKGQWTSWSSYAVTVGKQTAVAPRVGLRGSVGIGRHRFDGGYASTPMVPLELSFPIRVTSQISIGPQFRHVLMFDCENSGLLTVMGVGVRWQQRRVG